MHFHPHSLPCVAVECASELPGGPSGDGRGLRRRFYELGGSQAVCQGEAAGIPDLRHRRPRPGWLHSPEPDTEDHG